MAAGWRQRYPAFQPPLPRPAVQWPLSRPIRNRFHGIRGLDSTGTCSSISFGRPHFPMGHHPPHLKCAGFEVSHCCTYMRAIAPCTNRPTAPRSKSVPSDSTTLTTCRPRSACRVSQIEPETMNSRLARLTCRWARASERSVHRRSMDTFERSHDDLRSRQSTARLPRISLRPFLGRRE